MEGEELAAQDVAHGRAHHEPGLEHADVERGVRGGHDLVQEGEAQGDDRSGAEPMQQLPEDEHKP